MVVGARPMLLLDGQYHALMLTLGRKAKLRRDSLHGWKKRMENNELQTIDPAMVSIPFYLPLLYRHYRMISIWLDQMTSRSTFQAQPLSDARREHSQEELP